MAERTAVIGLDGAAWHLLEPLFDQGVMPNLRALRDRGASGVMRSTIPTYTPPAWTSAITGVNPGRHGIYGFNEGHAQNRKPPLVHSGKIRATPLWEMVATQGARAGIYNVPLTYPPQPLNGWMVSGMMTPGYGDRLKRFTYPPELEQRVYLWADDYVCDLTANLETDWRDERLTQRALDTLHQRITVLRGLLDVDPPDVVFSVLETPDRLQHLYYRYLDPQDPLYDSAEGERLRPHIARCFGAMDEFVGLLAGWADGGVIVCSDHGFTAWDVSVHLNALLAHWGYLRLRRSARLMQTGVARSGVRIAKRVLPQRVARQAKRQTFAAIDWTKTRAFASFIPQQGIHISVKGRDPFGIVDPADVDALKTEIAARFAELKDSTGAPITDAVHRAEDVFRGDAAAGAPDLMPVLRDHRYELDDEIFHRSPFSDVHDLPRGVHHPDGVVVVAGPGVAPDVHLRAGIVDVTPTLLYMAGMSVPEGLDGRVMTEAFTERHLEDRPVAMLSPISSKRTEAESPYTEEEEALIEESLRGLGYL